MKRIARQAVLRANTHLLTFRLCSPPSIAILSGCRASYSFTSIQATVPKPPMKYMSLEKSSHVLSDLSMNLKKIVATERQLIM